MMHSMTLQKTKMITILKNFAIKSTLLMIQYMKTLIMAYIDQVSQKHKTPMKRL